MGDAMTAMREIDLSAGRIRYTDTGTGEPILFVHGLLASGALWSMVVSELDSDFRCVVPELPLGAHHYPMKPDAELSPRAVARMLAELIARFVLPPSDAFEHFFPPAFRPLQWLSRIPGGRSAALQPVRIPAVRNSPLGFGWLSKRGIPNELAEEALRPYFTNKAIRRDMEKFVRAVDKKDTLAAAERLRDFDRPTLLAWAREDKYFKVKLAQRLMERLPQGRLELIDDSWTFVPIDQPKRLAGLIRELVRSTS